MQDPHPASDALAKAELAQLSSELAALRDTLLETSLMLKDHLASLQSSQAQAARRMAERTIQLASGRPDTEP